MPPGPLANLRKTWWVCVCGAPCSCMSKFVHYAVKVCSFICVFVGAFFLFFFIKLRPTSHDHHTSCSKFTLPLWHIYHSECCSLNSLNMLVVLYSVHLERRNPLQTTVTQEWLKSQLLSQRLAASFIHGHVLFFFFLTTHSTLSTHTCTFSPLWYIFVSGVLCFSSQS